VQALAREVWESHATDAENDGRPSWSKTNVGTLMKVHPDVSGELMVNGVVPGSLKPRLIA